MKIVVLHPKMTVLGGGERLCLLACQALMKDGHDVKVLCDDISLEEIEKIFGKKLDIELCPTFKPFKPFLINRFLVYQRAFQASRQIKKVKKYLKDADVIFSTQDVLFLPREKYAYTVQYVHFPEYLYHRERTKGLSLFFWNIYYRPIRRWIWRRLNNVDLFLCNSVFTKNAIRERWLRDAEIIYPPVEVEEFTNKEEKFNQVISIGRFHPEKNYEVVLKIANKVPESEFFIAGIVTDEAYYSRLQKIKPKNVHLLPNLGFSTLKDLLAKSRFYLHTMKGEHFGIAIVEAMASGCIPIVHSYGGPSEFVVHGRNGMLYSDWMEVVDFIRTLMKLPHSKLSQMREEAIKTAKNFDKAVFETKIRRVFKRIDDSLKTQSAYRVNMVTTWDKRCGIAYYTKFLTNELSRFVKVNIIPIEKDKPSLKDLGYFILLASVAKRNCDLLHIQHEYSFFGGRLLNRFFDGLMHIPFFARLIYPKKPIIVITLHELRKDKRISRIAKMWYRLVDRILFKYSDILIVHTRKAKEELIRRGASKEKLRVIPSGSCINPISLSKRKCKIRLGLRGRKVLTIFGFVHKDKGHDLLIEILPKLRNFVLLVAGVPRTREVYTYYEELKRRVDELGLNRKVKFLGFVPEEEIATVVNASDILVLPYRHITQSGVIGILLPYKVPIITSDLDCFKEIKNLYDCILLFEKDNKTDLLKKIKFLCANREHKSKLIANAEKFWRETNWNDVARKTYRIYALVRSGGYPDIIYAERRQQDRIDWLKRNTFGEALEIGCATGYLTKILDAKVGVDIRRDRLICAKNRCPDKDFVLADARHLPFHHRIFSTSIMAELLEHIPFNECPNVVSEVRRVSGALLITLPNASKKDYDKDLVESPDHKWFPKVGNVFSLLGDVKIEYTPEEDFMLIKCKVGDVERAA